MAVRAKFHVTAITTNEHGGKTVKLECRYDSTIPEDQRFLKATPWGTIEMQIDNPVAMEQFTLGADFYADFSPVPAPVA